MGFYLLCDWGLPILAGGQNVPPEGGSWYGFSMALLLFILRWVKAERWWGVWVFWYGVGYGRLGYLLSVTGGGG